MHLKWRVCRQLATTIANSSIQLSPMKVMKMVCSPTRLLIGRRECSGRAWAKFRCPRLRSWTRCQIECFKSCYKMRKRTCLWRSRLLPSVRSSFKIAISRPLWYLKATINSSSHPCSKATLVRSKTYAHNYRGRMSTAVCSLANSNRYNYSNNPPTSA